jgi:hypothetical protein
VLRLINRLCGSPRSTGPSPCWTTKPVSGPAEGESRTARRSWAASDRWDELAAEASQLTEASQQVSESATGGRCAPRLAGAG